MPRPEIPVREGDQSIGADLRRARLSVGLRVTDMDLLTGLGKGYISGAETGLRSPSHEMVVMYARILGLECEALLPKLRSKRKRRSHRIDRLDPY